MEEDLATIGTQKSGPHNVDEIESDRKVLQYSKEVVKAHGRGLQKVI